MVDYPSVKFKADQLPGVNWLMGEKSGKPRVVQQSELVEVSSLVCHHAGVNIV